MRKIVLLLLCYVLFLTSSANPVINREGDPKKCICQIILNNYGSETNCPSNKKLMEENARMNETIRQLQMELEALKAIQDTPNTDKYEIVMEDGARWRAFWWFEKGSGWPSGNNDVLGDKYGSCNPNASYCFSRLPEQLLETGAEILGKDSAGTTYRWTFDAANPTAHAAWLALHDHQQTVAGAVVNNQNWNPKVITGTAPKANQDSFMYRTEHGVASLLLDDDNCDCLSTLSLGHGMCKAGFSTVYGPENRFGVDLLYDSACQTPSPDKGLTLYFRDDDNCTAIDCGQGLKCADGIDTYKCI